MSQGSNTQHKEYIVNNIVIILYGDIWLLDFWGDNFVMYLNVKSLRCKPETNIILHINSNSIKK